MEENIEKINYMQSQIERANEENMKILIGGDMNGHIWELDKCENVNGRFC